MFGKTYSGYMIKTTNISFEVINPETFLNTNKFYFVDKNNTIKHYDYSK
jgi:hypothetical protein